MINIANYGGIKMPYVQCKDCKTMVHFKPIDIKEFNKRFVEGNEPVYCFKCFRKREEKEVTK